MWKIDSNGNYCDHPGVTLICKAQSSVLTEVHSILSSNKELLSFFSPLPEESYHMTVFDLYSARNLKNAFTSLDEIVKLRDTFKEIEYGPVLTISDVYFRGTCGLLFEDTDATVSTINYWRSVASSITNLPNGSYKYHLTFGYAFDVPDPMVVEKLVKSLRELLRGKKLALLPPRVCFFPDMQKYIDI